VGRAGTSGDGGGMFSGTIGIELTVAIGTLMENVRVANFNGDNIYIVPTPGTFAGYTTATNITSYFSGGGGFHFGANSGNNLQNLLLINNSLDRNTKFGLELGDIKIWTLTLTGNDISRNNATALGAQMQVAV
jgi:hypothetical protein